MRVERTVAQHLRHRALGHVRRLEVARLAQVGDQLVALGGGRDGPAGQDAGKSGQRSRSSLKAAESGFGEFGVNGDATVISVLIDPPERSLTSSIVPSWSARVYVAHSVHIEAGVFNEPLPLTRVGLPSRAPQLHVLRTRFREKLDQLLAVLVLGLVLRHAEHVAELAEATRQPML